MSKSLRWAAGIAAAVFVMMGLTWMVAPEVVGAQLGMTLQKGRGLSSQVGDLFSFFVTLGSCVLIGLRTGQRVWLFPAMMLLGLAAFGRTLAWAAHGATFAFDLIGAELLGVLLLYAVSRVLAKDASPGGLQLS